MKCIAFKPLTRGSLLGFVDLQMDNGLVMLGCTWHEANGKQWVNPPGRPQLDADRKPMYGDGGKMLYAPVIDFADATVRARWSAAAVAACRAYNNALGAAVAGTMAATTAPKSKAPATEGAGAMTNRTLTPEPAKERSRDGA